MMPESFDLVLWLGPRPDEPRVRALIARYRAAEKNGDAAELLAVFKKLERFRESPSGLSLGYKRERGRLDEDLDDNLDLASHARLEYEDRAPLVDQARSEEAAFGGYGPEFRKPVQHAPRITRPDRVRAALAEAAIKHGYSSLSDLLHRAPARKGKRTTDAMQAVRDLGEVAREVHALGATLEMIGAEIGRDKTQVSRLAGK
jgi:hypothetical protein